MKKGNKGGESQFLLVLAYVWMSSHQNTTQTQRLRYDSAPSTGYVDCNDGEFLIQDPEVQGVKHGTIQARKVPV